MMGKVYQQQGELSRAGSTFEKARELSKRVLKEEVEDKLALIALEHFIPFWSR